ncbi:hypothetical protein Syun_014230 [Stephania yunnanensis]|uniref:Uncharacterized protein n=1 Tax=Stephania yunnanensis TaxID=152371 RepID=A0AAP0JJQ7_9MAGN
MTPYQVPQRLMRCLSTNPHHQCLTTRPPIYGASVPTPGKSAHAREDPIMVLLGRHGPLPGTLAPTTASYLASQHPSSHSKHTSSNLGVEATPRAHLKIFAIR